MIGVITPWNWPYTMPAELIAPALACGNAVVWTPATTTSVAAVALAECIAEADLPPGVFNLVTGPGSVVGDEIARNPGTHGVGFIGSTETGRKVAEAAAGKALVLELGGNGPVVVLEDADLDSARRRDLPASWLIKDATLIEIARRRGRTARDAESIRGLQLRKGAQLDGMLAAVAAASATPPPGAADGDLPGEVRRRVRVVLPLASAVLQARCGEAGVASELVATRAELESLIAGQAMGGDGTRPTAPARLAARARRRVAAAPAARRGGPAGRPAGAARDRAAGVTSAAPGAPAGALATLWPWSARR